MPKRGITVRLNEDATSLLVAGEHYPLLGTFTGPGARERAAAFKSEKKRDGWRIRTIERHPGGRPGRQGSHAPPIFKVYGLP